MRLQEGFTLIELMVVMVIIAILAAVAIPGYQRYIIRSAESQAQARMMTIQMELERWRASTLSYRNFKSQQPLTTANDRYTIKVVNGSGGAFNAAGMTGARSATSWVMLATPKSDLKGASRILLTSSGLRCKSISDNFCTTLNNNCQCGTGTQQW